MPTAFISGPLDIDQTYFDKYYLPSISDAISQSHDFVIGPVSGIDTLALAYLTSHPSVLPTQISVYMTSWEAPSHTLRLSELGVNQGILGPEVVTTRERDAAMTRDSDYDILRFRTEMECKELYGGGWRARVSNTEMNWRRRRGEGEKVGYVRHVGEGEGIEKKKVWQKE
ncbi:hypothetical protein CERZMDRAFT_88596 [Cercospora zeae-maydis SCOH1-5]|uniref:Uncharacterized protein n=1 Tax=Cercospora zeae-maydis SCOH1-5 TaxID=717836 RepID=A0A6A6F1R9_9PEZI|nr:hypothetical protein CERZMDRAFT_88596 [Cercospora zeae-maydis SCOH1-5]